MTLYNFTSNIRSTLDSMVRILFVGEIIMKLFNFLSSYPDLFCFWNTSNMIDQKQEIIQFLSDYNIDILLVKKAFLKLYHKFPIPNYRTICNDVPTPRSSIIKYSISTKLFALSTSYPDHPEPRLHPDCYYFILPEAYYCSCRKCNIQTWFFDRQSLYGWRF